MHELSVCRGLLRQVTRLAEAHDAAAVSRIRLRIGPLSGIEIALLRQAFPQARRGTLAENAQLEIETIPLHVHCPDCGREGPAKPNDLRCPFCGSAATRLVSGDELLLVDFHIEPKS